MRWSGRLEHLVGEGGADDAILLARVAEAQRRPELLVLPPRPHRVLCVRRQLVRLLVALLAQRERRDRRRFVQLDPCPTARLSAAKRLG